MAKTESEKNKFLNKVKQQCSNKQAQENIYLTLFGASNANKKEGSFFLTDEQFISKPLTYPEAEQVKVWDNGKWSKIEFVASFKCYRFQSRVVGVNEKIILVF